MDLLMNIIKYVKEIKDNTDIEVKINYNIDKDIITMDFIDSEGLKMFTICDTTLGALIYLKGFNRAIKMVKMGDMGVKI